MARLSPSLVLALVMAVTAACGPKPPPVSPEVGQTDAPAESDEDALRRELLASLRELVANVVSSETSRPLNPDIVPFLTKAYELVGERQDELLRKADLAIKFASMEIVGQALSFADCVKACSEGSRDACELVDKALHSFGGDASDLRAAVEWAAYPQLAFRQLAITLFGRVDAYAVTDVREVDGALYAQISLRSGGARVEWLFNIAFESEHRHWHVLAVAQKDAVTQTPARGDAPGARATMSL